MHEIIKVDYEKQNPTVSARELHQFLEVQTHFKDWFPRMCEYGFTEGSDFCSILSESTGGRPSTDYEITVPMAKEICMIQRSEKGKQARQYFIALENAWNTPEMVLSRALKLADSKLQALQIVYSRLSVSNAIMQPKADYFDQLVDRNLLTNFRDTAKEFDVKQNVFINFLLEKKFIYRDAKGTIKPYADKNNGLFELKEAKNDISGWAGVQTFITPKGRETFRLLLQNS